jgi:hypothetical protein
MLRIFPYSVDIRSSEEWIMPALRSIVTRHLVAAGMTMSLFTFTANAGSCAAYVNCPLDGAQALLVDTEYQGIAAIGVYEHTTTTGQKHRFRARCN